MDIKKDWNKIVYAVLLLIGTVFFAIALFKMMGETDAVFSEYSLYLAGTIFFLGATAYCVLRMFKKTDKVAKWIMLGIGAVNTILALVFLFAKVETGATAMNGFEMIFETGMAVEATPFVTMILVFALLPLVKGIKTILTKEQAA